MPTLSEVRQQYPQYSHLSDAEFADNAYRTWYADKISRADFDQKLGVTHASAPAAGLNIPRAIGEGIMAANPVTGPLRSLSRAATASGLMEPAPAAPAEPGAAPAWQDVPEQAIRNLPSSTVQFGKDLAQPFIHP